MRIEESPGPGEYEVEKAEVLTRPTTTTTKISNSPSRPKSFAIQSQINNLGPGSYIDGNIFGKEVKPVYIRARPKEIFQDPTRGPGNYNPELAESVTKPRPKSAFIPRENRKMEVAIKQEGADAGKYNPHKEFGFEVKPHTIGRRRETKSTRNIGPG